MPMGVLDNICQWACLITYAVADRRNNTWLWASRSRVFVPMDIWSSPERNHASRSYEAAARWLLPNRARIATLVRYAEPFERRRRPDRVARHHHPVRKAGWQSDHGRGRPGQHGTNHRQG